MKAMQIVSFAGPASGLRYQEAPTPEPGPGQIAVDVDHAGVGYVEALFTEGFVPIDLPWTCLLYTSPSPRDQRGARMPSSA